MNYPSFLRRYFGMLIDVLALLFLFGLIAQSGLFDANHVSGITLFALLALAYDPLLTVFGATLGQFLMRFRVRTLGEMKRISLFQAYFRFVVKSLLGVLSIITVATRKDRRAIHDMAAKTIVINSSALSSPAQATNP